MKRLPRLAALLVVVTSHVGLTQPSTPGSTDRSQVIAAARAVMKNVTRKVAQLRKDSRATLLYFDRATLSYVTLLGGAILVSDPVEKEKHWQAQWAPFYREGFKSPDLLLIRFTTRSLEIVSGSHKLVNDPQTWRPVTVEFK